MKKKMTLCGLAMGLAVMTSMTAFAGQWKQDSKGWWYQEDNGSYPVSKWREVGGKQYYFGVDGYMLSNTTTPDGYKVGADGAWIEDNKSQEEGDIEFLRYRAGYIDWPFRNQMAEYYNNRVHAYTNYISLDGKRYFLVVRMYDNKGNPLQREDIGYYENKKFRTYLAAMDENSGNIDYLYEFPAMDGYDMDVVEDMFMARGKFCFATRYFPTSEYHGVETYYQYDLRTGEVKETSKEENEAFKVRGRYLENDHLYYTLSGTSKESHIEARNYKNELVIDITVPYDCSKYIPNGYNHQFSTDEIVGSSDTSITYKVKLYIKEPRETLWTKKIFTLEVNKKSGEILNVTIDTTQNIRLNNFFS